MKRIFFLSFLLFVLACYSGIRPKGETLKESWKRYWTYTKQGDFKKAFYYEHLSISTKITPEKYAKNQTKTLTIKAFEFLGIGKEGSGPHGSTPVKMKLVTNWPRVVPIKEDRIIVINDYWVKKKGKWYHLKPGATRYW